MPVLKSFTSPFQYWVGCKKGHWFQSWPLQHIAYYAYLVAKSWPTKRHGSGESILQSGTSPYHSFHGLEHSAQHHNCIIILWICPCATTYVLIHKWHMDLDHQDYGFNYSFWVNFLNSWTHSSLSFTKSRSSFCIGIITLPYLPTAGIHMYPFHHLVFSLLSWTTLFMPLCMGIIF